MAMALMPKFSSSSACNPGLVLTKVVLVAYFLTTKPVTKVDFTLSQNAQKLAHSNVKCEKKFNVCDTPSHPDSRAGKRTEKDGMEGRRGGKAEGWGKEKQRGVANPQVSV